MLTNNNDPQSGTPNVIDGTEELLNDEELDDEPLDEDADEEETEEVEEPEDSDEGDEDETPDETTSEDDTDDEPDDVEDVIARYGNDPKKLAEALRNKQQVIDRQGNELGTLRPKSGQLAPNGATPTDHDKIPEKFFEDIDDGWKQLPVDEETGYPLEDDGPIRPFDQFGVDFTPPSYWEKRAEQYANSGMSPALVAIRITEERSQDLAQYRSRIGAKLDQADQYIDVVGSVHEKTLTKSLGKQGLTEVEAKYVASKIVGIALGEAKSLVRQGKVRPQNLYNKAGAQVAIDVAVNEAWRNGDMDKMIEEVRKTGGKKPVMAKPAPKTRSATTMPRTNGATMPRNTDGAITPKEKAKYSSKSTVFED